MSTTTAYSYGANDALTQLGLTKTASPLREWFRRTLTGPYGEYVTRVPVQGLMGGIGGAGTGLIMDGEHPGNQALWGALMGAGGGLAVAGAPHLRTTLLKRLSG